MTDTAGSVAPDALFRTMADAAPVLLWMSREDSLCIFFNRSWLDFRGRTLEEEWGVGWAEGIHFEDFQRCVDTYISAFNARRVFEMEYRLQRADGEYRWILDRGTPRYVPDGRFAGYIGSCIDITERKAMEVELRQAVRARDEFIQIASHELKTPLTPLQLQIERLRLTLKNETTGPTSAKIASALESAERQVGRLGALVERLLDLSQISAGRLELEPEAVDLSALVKDVVHLFKLEASRSGIWIDVLANGPIIGQWDRHRLEQVVGNLLGNALKYGDGRPVTVRVEADARVARLEVQDRGIGIAPIDQQRIFERFERAVPRAHYSGFGIGLWITRRIVQEHGGTIEVASEVGTGATFKVELPLGPSPSG